MPTHITQVEDPEREIIILRVEGDLMHDDAILLEKIALGMRSENEKDLILDLSDLDLMDSESAPVIKRLEVEHGFKVEGLHFFLQKMIQKAEK